PGHVAAGHARPADAGRGPHHAPHRGRRGPHHRPRGVTRVSAPIIDLVLRPAPRTVVFTDAGWSSSVARWAHNPEVAGSNPVPATQGPGPESSHWIPALSVSPGRTIRLAPR